MPSIAISWDDNICQITLQANEKNFINKKILLELNDAIKNALLKIKIKALFLYADSNFCSGFDFDTFLQLKNEDDAKIFALDFQQMLTMISVANIPIVAIVRGNCFGAGLEIALACKYVVCSSTKTSLAFNEIKYGFTPFGIGIIKLLKKLDYRFMINLLFSGEKISSVKAKKYNLVHACIDDSKLISYSKKLIFSTSPIQSKQISLRRILKNELNIKDIILYKTNNILKLIEIISFEKILIEKYIKNYLHKINKYNHNYFNIFYKTIIKCLNHKHDQTVNIELANTFALLLFTKEAKNLLSIYKELQKKQTKISKLVLKEQVEYYYLNHLYNGRNYITIIGANNIGIELVLLLAINGIKCIITDENFNNIQNSLNFIDEKLRNMFKNDEIDVNLKNFMKLNIIPIALTDYNYKAKVIFYVANDNLKYQKNYLNIINTNDNDFILINSSPYSITNDFNKKVNIANITFIPPVQKNPIILIYHNSKISTIALSFIEELFIKINKKYFYLYDNFIKQSYQKIIFNYCLEAIYLLLEGASIEEIDNALEKFGFKLLPFQYMDNYGFKHILEISNQIISNNKDIYNIPPEIVKFFHSERNGISNGLGFYEYRNNKKFGSDLSVYDYFPNIKAKGFVHDTEIINRCIKAMLVEFKYNLENAIIQDQNEANIISIFACGFPIITGEIFNYALTNNLL